MIYRWRLLWDFWLMPVRLYVGAGRLERKMPEQKTHDLSVRSWGRNYEVLEITEEGRRLRMAGWATGIKNGDYLLLAGNIASVDGRTRYQVEEIEYANDPPDQWFATARFAPRDVIQQDFQKMADS